MFGHKKPKTAEVEQPERLHYTKYYEHDGALRAYANRAMVLACSMSLLALLSLAFAIYVRMQPPTIIRVSADGESTVLSGRPLFRKQVPGALLDPRQSAQPQGYEKEAFIRQFLDHYLNYELLAYGGSVMPGEVAHGAKSTPPLRTLADRVNWLISAAHPARPRPLQQRRGRGPDPEDHWGAGLPHHHLEAITGRHVLPCPADAAANDGEMAGGRGGSGASAYPVSPTALTEHLAAYALVRQSLSVIVVLQCAQRGFDLRGRLSFQAALMANTDWVDMN